MAEPSSRPRPRKAVGPPRPTYLRPEDTDKVMTVVLALMSEVAALRERLDTHERLAESGIVATVDAIEAYVPDDAVEASREAWRDAYIKRLLRVALEELETAPASAPVE